MRGYSTLNRKPLQNVLLTNVGGGTSRGAEWDSDYRLELSFGGMGYSTSLLFDAASSNGVKEFNDLLLYDAEGDVYVRYVHDFVCQLPPVSECVDSTTKLKLLI